MLTAVLAAVLAAAAAALATPLGPDRRRLAARRGPADDGAPASVVGHERPGGPARRPGPSRQQRRMHLGVGALAGVAAWWLLGGLAGLGLAVALVALVPPGLARLEPASWRRERVALVRGAPLLADLLAAALASGTPLEHALPVVAAAVGGPTRARLDPVLRLIELGHPADRAWAQVSDLPGLGGIARTAGRSARTGAPLGQLLAISAVELRADAEAAALVEIRRAGIRAVLPLGLCLLPAFAILAVVPLVVGLLPSF